MSNDPFTELKQRQREMWSSFAPMASFTTPTAAHLVKFSQVKAGETVLDAGCGTGVVAITAARAGAKVSAIDLTPELLEVAKANAVVAGCQDIDWREGDVEQLPWPDASFDKVLSQFGHMFAPRPEVTLAEMARVLKPSGLICFATWPPEHFVGSMFAFVSRHSPPPPAGASPPWQWGSVPIVAERLEKSFGTPFFERGVMKISALSLPHFREMMERSVGPMQTLVKRLGNDAEKLQQVRHEFEELARPYYWDNQMHQSYLLTRARAV